MAVNGTVNAVNATFKNNGGQSTIREVANANVNATQASFIDNVGTQVRRALHAACRVT